MKKISKDTIAPTLLWDLPPVGVDPVLCYHPSVTPKTPLPETLIPPSIIGANEPQVIDTSVSRPGQQQIRPIKKEDTEIRPIVHTTADTEASLPPPPTPPFQKEREGIPKIPVPPPLPVQKTEVPLPPGPGVSNIPPPPPPPPVVRRLLSVPPAVPILTRRQFEPREEDLHSQLFARIRERRSAIEEEPPAPKKDNDNNDDEWE